MNEAVAASPWVAGIHWSMCSTTENILSPVWKGEKKEKKSAMNTKAAQGKLTQFRCFLGCCLKKKKKKKQPQT